MCCRVTFSANFPEHHPHSGRGVLSTLVFFRQVLGDLHRKSKNVEQWAGLWMRIDGKENPRKSLGFDNMQNRPIKGNTDWKYYNVVLDVPEEANKINFGILLAGTGEILFSNLNFEVVDKSVPTTNAAGYKPPSEPKNLDLNK